MKFVRSKDILSFFTTSQRDKNDATNKIREMILPLLSNSQFIEDEKYGKYWKLVGYEWACALDKIALLTEIPKYTSVTIGLLGGRSHNHDANVKFYNEENIVGTRKIEFKSGCSGICKLPQFLSIPAKIDIFPKSYPEYWYENFIDKYIACDSEITEEKPPLGTYLKNVGCTDCKISPFFSQLKLREPYFKKEKNDVVNTSINDYLEMYGKDINVEIIKEKIKTSQADKIFVMWSQQSHRFCIDMLLESEKNDIAYHSIKNGNVIQLQSGTAMYGLLLRWKNHKGVLNPAWQISMKRVAISVDTPNEI
jgi:hypothetical protein